MSVLRRLSARPVEQRALSSWPGPQRLGGFVSGYGQFGSQAYTAANVESAMQVVAVYACIRIISNSVSTLPLYLYREGDLVRERVEMGDRTQVLLGRYPHPRIPAGEFYGLTAAHLAGWGNAFLWKGRAVKGGPVRSLFPVLPSMVGVSLLEDGTPEYTVTMANGERKVTTTDVLHIRGFGVDGIVGLSPVGVARKAVESMKLDEDYRINLLSNDARVSGVLSSDNELSPEAAERLAARWKAAHGGPGKAGGTAVLEGGMKWQQLSLSTEDMQFIEQRRYSVAEIARLFGVPPSKVNAETSSGLTYATTESENQAYTTDTLTPYLTRIEQALDADLDLVPEGLVPAFNVDGLLRADARTRADVQKIKVDMGTLTRDEARAEDGRGPLPETDDVVVDVAPSNPETEDEAE